MDSTEDKISSIVGPPGAPLKVVKGKEARGRVSTLLDTSNEAPEVQLRAYVGIGRTPPLRLLFAENILRALNIGDRVKYLSRLSTKTYFLNAEPALSAIAKSLGASEAREVNRLAARLARSAKKWGKAKRSPAPTDGTVIHFLDVLNLLLPKAKSGRGRDSFLTLMKLGISWAASSQHENAVLLATETLLLARRRLGIDVRGALEQDETLTQCLRAVEERSLQKLKTIAMAGDVLSFERWGHAVLESSSDASKAKAELEAMFREGARYSEPIQKAFRNLLDASGFEGKAPGISLEAGESIQTSQLASALLRAWNARDEGQKAREAFEELRSVLSRFWGIKLGGEVGATEAYNPRVHEFVHGEIPGSVVQLIRPWVEVSQDGKVSVLIKALVRAKP
jgi:hypothetical protein